MALRELLALLVQRLRFILAPQARVSRLVRGIILGSKYGLPMRIDKQDRSFEAPGLVRETPTSWSNSRTRLSL